MANILAKVLSFGEGKELKRLYELAVHILTLEPKYQAQSDADLAANTAIFRQHIEQGNKLDSILPDAFAVVREVAKRTLNMRHFDVQIMGGMVLHEGKIAEMATGEGKTLVATLPVYLNSLSGCGVHLVTVNDYLAKRDSEWMGAVYRFLGLSVGLLQHDSSNSERRQAYMSDVIYGTNTEFGFDYLRDNMVTSRQQKVQCGHHYAIVDEVDSILIDEARTPLIISGPSEESTGLYYQFASIAPRLIDGEDYEKEEKTRTASVTEQGVAKVEKMTGIKNLYNIENTHLIHHLNQALRAHRLYKRDVDYIVKDGEVIIVDEFTGRLMFGRRYSEGLHQAIEAKERVKIREENQTLATITLQNYFRMYEKLAGMTGTAATEANEFRHIYKLETVVIPTNRPLVRNNMQDIVYKTEAAKFKAVVDDICERNKQGQPVLVGTISIEKSELLSQMLSRRGVKHEVLNAKHHEREAMIVAKAGQHGAVTIATNMAGRGTDIVLGDGVVELRGLHVLGTERHESRRIDNQLRGRSGRQGDPGSSQFYVSLEDDLMRMFGSDRIIAIMERFNFPDDEPIVNGFVTKSIENAQRQVESRNFDIRKHLLEYDDVMNKQREIIYQQRDMVLEKEDISENIKQMLVETTSRMVDAYAGEESYPEDWDLKELAAQLSLMFATDFVIPSDIAKSVKREEIMEFTISRVLEIYDKKVNELGVQSAREIERLVMLRVIDFRWREHLYELDYLKEGIGLRAIGQMDPLVEFKRESFEMFQEMIDGIKEDVVRYFFRVKVIPQEQKDSPPVSTQGRPLKAVTNRPPESREAVSSSKVGRNDPCPCGSGKKYKKCCGA
ncbi:MAG: preprotein translocase subunit SecA [Actinobacteria bacterium]|nr:preprotein translocase subunit SecA [Actinomycetota bacterium]